MSKSPLSSGFSLAKYDIIDSTNEEAKRLAGSGAKSGTVVWSKSQTAGRGRHGNTWISPPGNLYTSILLRMECDSATASQLAFLAALAVRDALPVDNVYFKWPNDVLSADYRKLSGILLEAKTNANGKAEWVIVGIGVNVATAPPDNKVDRPAVSLKTLMNKVEVEELLQNLLDSFANWFAVWRKEGFEPVRLSWLENAAFLGDMVTINMDRKNVTAKFKDVNDKGELVILLPDGRELAISAGDLFLGRAKKV